MLYPRLHKMARRRDDFALEGDVSPEFHKGTDALRRALKEIELWREQHCGCYETPEEVHVCTVHRRMQDG